MPDAIAGLLVLALAAERMFAEWLHARERRYLTNATIAKTPGELRVLEESSRRRQPKPVQEEIDGFEGQVGL